MMIRKFITVCALAFAVSGCAALAQFSNPITPQRVIATKRSAGVVLAGAVAYHDSCAQRLIDQSCRLIVPKVVVANRKVQLALKKLTDLQKLGPTIDLTEAYHALSDAVNDLKLLVPGE